MYWFTEYYKVMCWLSAFKVAVVKNGNKTVENLKNYFTDLKKHISPVNAYQWQQYYRSKQVGHSNKIFRSQVDQYSNKCDSKFLDESNNILQF